MNVFYKKQLFLGLLLALFIVSTIFAFSVPTFAQNTTDTLGISAVDQDIALGSSDIRVTIVRIINIFLGLLGIIAVGIVLYGGFIYMTAGGNDEKVGTAKKILINGVIGLVIIMSSWAITSFVLKKLSEATGIVTTTDELCGDASYKLTHPGECGATSACADSDYKKAHPNLCSTDACSDYSEDFVVKSITPVTDSTGMNNVVIRVLFNHPLGDGFTADQSRINSIISDIKHDNYSILDRVDIKLMFESKLDEDDVYYGVEVRLKEGTLERGNYAISVNPSVSSYDGTQVTEKSDCGEFPLSASFGISHDNIILDNILPEVSIIMGNMIEEENAYIAYGGEFYLLDIESTDNSGIGYVDVSIEGSVTSHYYTGPSVKHGSDAPIDNPYKYTYRFDAPDPGDTTKEYDIKFYITDIDSNTKLITKHVIVRPELCIENPTDPICNTGGDYDTCKTDSDCSLGFKCLDTDETVCIDTDVDCVCRAWPYIKQVDYMNGAVGNWITIQGYHFGDGDDDISEVNFNFGDIQVPAVVTACSNDVWHDNWIVVEVPTAVSDVKPSISVTNDDGFTDFTNDIGVGPDLGTFEYNDTVRPGLCSVTVVENDAMEYTLPSGVIFGFGVGDTMAPPSIPVVAQGKSFGTYESGMSSLKFGNFVAAISAQSWSDEAINATVPFMDAGSVATMVQSIGGLQSNSVPFTILGQEDLFPPVITSIDPINTTPGSYITIFGTNFGTGGIVSIGGLPSATLPDYCGDTWSDTQIIVKVPETIGVGDATIRVTQSDNGLSSKGDWSVFLEDGNPKPSLCVLSPSSGGVTEKITLRGENFTSSPTALFWTFGADPDGDKDWLYTPGDDDREIITNIPTDSDTGKTMITGPIKVKSSDGAYSNSMIYTIADCREPGATLSDDFKNNYQCCTEGPEAGYWKKGTAVCEGGVREAGYMWRFTTGKIPKQFYVIESCDLDTGSPSPTPWESWKQGKEVCLNAQIETRFSLPINNESVGVGLVEQAGITKGPINSSNIRIFTCGSADVIDCEVSDDVTSEFDVEVVGQSKTSFIKKDASELSANTWYRVALYDGVLSQEVTTELGIEETKNTKLLATQECNTGDLGKAAYCFEFKTGTGQCTLISAGIHEKQYTTDLLGVVQDNRYKRVFDFALVWEPAFVKPLYYRVFGVADQECTTLNVDDKPWDWGPVDTMLNATAEHYPINTSTPLSVGIATAQRQDLVGAEIFATLEEAGESIKATSTLKINLGDPRIIAKEPVCIEACINTTISARFNQLIIKNNFVNGVTLSECKTELCQEFEKTIILSDISDPDDTMMRLGQDFLTNGGYLEPSTWYLVEVNSDDIEDINKIKGIAGKKKELGVDGKPVYISGNNAVSTNWKFKTKNSAEACIVDMVEVKPDPFTAYFIGQTQDYVSLPKGAPDACNAQGQYLSSWDYGWEWTIPAEDEGEVAEITQFPATLKTNNSCTISCLPKGSDVSKNVYSGSFPSCGNAIKDPGEDCDIAGTDPNNNAETPGKSCNYNCLRLGNVNSTSSVFIDTKNTEDTIDDEIINKNLCGDGFVSYADGEQCDINDPDLIEKGIQNFCNDICRWTGSQKDNTDPDNIYVPVCGSGDVTPGESCDIAVNPKGCSESCLNTGTPLSQNWCDDSNNVNENSQPYCNIATSICGNGIIESDEECEVTGPNAISENYCSDRCLVQNVCDDDSVKQCNGGETPEEGCNPDCTYAGSSVLYDTPSLCGNGDVEIGEYPVCELGTTGEVSDFDGPIQIVTSVGTSPIDSSVTTSMYTTISAQAAAIRNGEGAFDPITSLIDGSGDYTLMCGNSEYIKESDNHKYNDCSANTENTYGVGYNSCCQARPVRSAQYPQVNAGMEGAVSAPVCRNTYLEVEFENAEISEQSFTDDNSVRIVQGYTDEDHECAEGQQDVTDIMKNVLAFVPGEDIGFWGTIWGTIKSFFAKLFSGEVFAIDLLPVGLNNVVPNGVTWCTSDIKVTTHVVYDYDAVNKDVVIGSRAQMYMDGALDPDVYVAVMLDGGAQGIHNVQGVGLKSPFGSERSDVWVFKTGNAICKISSIDVEPDAHVFKTPTEGFKFAAQAISNVDNQQIVAIDDVYDWEWSWHPENNQLFDISPASEIILEDGTVNDASVTTIISQGVEGHIDGVLQADITADIFVNENLQLGETFTDSFGLTASFCANPWPHDATVVEDGGPKLSTINNKFVDNLYNFDTYYCADAQNPLSKVDDLPLFDNVVSLKDIGAGGVVPLSDDTLQRYFLFSDTTDDVIGVQIFENTPHDDGSRRTLEQWYIDKFKNLGDMKPTSIDGYVALTNGMTYYVNAYNIDKSPSQIEDIYNNIYQFTINENAGNSTQKVFEQFMNNLRFNINMSDHGYCLSDEVVVDNNVTYVVREVADDIASGDINNYTDVACTTDFDCRDVDAVPLSGTNGYCSNERTKFNRDLVRLQQVGRMQANITNHINTQKNANNFVGDIETSFIPGYTNSRWAVSWNRLATGVGGLAIDPINDWRGCLDHDPLTCWKAQDSTFLCPAFASIYEYQYDDTDDSFDIFTQTEYVKIGDAITAEFVDTDSVQFARSCESELLTVNPSTCGDGKVNYATEQCDPAGKEKATGVSCDFEGGKKNGYEVKVCNDTCQWEADKICKETTFGQGVNQKFLCGNNKLENSGEFCDTVGGVCTYKITQDGTILKPNVYILLDQSKPMSTNWDSAVNGISDLFRKVGSDINIGLSIWPETSCKDPREIFNINSYKEDELTKYINSLLIDVGNNDYDRSTAKALKYINEENKLSLSNDIHDKDREKNLILIIGGPPSQEKECLIDKSITTLDLVNREVYNELWKLKEKGVSTYVIGYDYDGDELDDYAQAGGTQKAYNAKDGNGLFDIMKQFFGCEEYAYNAVGSCSWDCNSYGGYCGDGYTQWDYEECDDANENNNDACKNNCTIGDAKGQCGNGFIEGEGDKKEQCDDGNTVSGDGCSSLCKLESDEPVCGDGEVNQTSEQCDLGNKNGIVCVPGYNESCTYCTGQCLIETFENPKRCGNGKIDYENGKALETCDYILDNKGKQEKVFSTSTPDGKGEICNDKGSYQCQSECQYLKNECVNCGIADNLTVPKLAIINPMVGAGVYPYTDPDDKGPYNEAYINLIRLKKSKVTYLGQRFLDKNDATNQDMNLFEQYFLLKDNNNQPDLKKGIETNNLCNDEYKLFFNKININNEKTEHEKDNEYQLQNNGFGYLFDYPVNGEQGIIENEVVMSPAVPEGDLRIVVRWKKKSAGDPIKFVGGMYNTEFSSPFIKYGDIQQTLLCQKIFKSSENNYWYPDTNFEGCNHLGLAYNKQDANVYMHKLLETDKSGTQAFTFDSKDSSLSKKIGFVVQSLNGPINQYKDYDIWVDIYENRINQSPEYSVYEPTKTYHFNQAQQSSNVLARYWHVFNIEKVSGKYQISEFVQNKNGIVLTKECQVQELVVPNFVCSVQ